MQLQIFSLNHFQFLNFASHFVLFCVSTTFFNFSNSCSYVNFNIFSICCQKPRKQYFCGIKCNLICCSTFSHTHMHTHTHSYTYKFKCTCISLFSVFVLFFVNVFVLIQFLFFVGFVFLFYIEKCKQEGTIADFNTNLGYLNCCIHLACICGLFLIKSN